MLFRGCRYPLPGKDILDLTKLPGPINEGSVHLWIADLKTWRSHAGKLRSLLSDDEIKRLDRLKIINKREEFLCSRGILRVILSKYISEDPNDILINYTPAGKPILSDAEIQFNISHSGDFLICGISLINRIGLDIQEIYSISSLDRIINNFFSPAEIQYLRTLPSRETYQEHFFAIWTAKEAYLKAVGDGIQGSFNQLSIIPESAALLNFRLDHPDLNAEDRQWAINTLEIAQGYRAAMAINGELLELQKFEINPGDIQ